MRKSFTLFLILFSSLFMYSQNLTIDELALLRKKSFSEVEEILSSKNWTFLEGHEPDSEKMGSAVFALNKKEYNDNAQSFFNFLYDNSEDEEMCNHRIVFQFFDKTKYNNYINRFKTLGCKLIKSKIVDGEIIKIYQGNTTTFQISIIAEKDTFGTTTRYKMFITSNVDYFIYYDEDTSLRDLLEKQIELEKD